MIVGTGFARNFGLTSSVDGIGPYGIAAVVIGASCLSVYRVHLEKKSCSCIRKGGMKITNIVDARGLSCPQPVILTLNEMKKTEKGEIVILVDADTSRENVSRAATSKA